MKTMRELPTYIEDPGKADTLVPATLPNEVRRPQPGSITPNRYPLLARFPNPIVLVLS